jgi:hypothetical protein
MVSFNDGSFKMSPGEGFVSPGARHQDKKAQYKLRPEFTRCLACDASEHCTPAELLSMGKFT